MVPKIALMGPLMDRSLDSYTYAREVSPKADRVCERGAINGS